MRQYRELASSLTRPLPLTIAALAAAGILVGNTKIPALSKQLSSRPVAAAIAAAPVSAKAALRSSGHGQLPLSFEPNVGQTDKDVRFLSRGPGYTLYLTADEAVMVLRSRLQTDKHEKPKSEAETAAVLRMKVMGADRAAAVRGSEKLPSYSNYLVGSDRTQWRTNVPNYGRVEYSSVYPGVDMVYYGNQRQLEYDFVVQPGADPSRIQLAFEGADKIRTEKGDLVLSVRGREIRQHKPVVYQTVAGRRVPVSAGYELLADSKQVKFSVANYDRSRPLVIDPTIVYGTYLGSAGDDLAFGIAADPTTAGIVYITGDTTSTTFPAGGTTKTTLGTPGGALDAYVTKINTAAVGAASHVFTTYFGGNGSDIGNGVRVDTTGIYLVGATSSTNFPTTNPIQPALAGGSDAFLAKLNSTGTAFIYSTYFGGSLDEYDFSLALDSVGSLYAIGQSDSLTLASGTPAALPSMTTNRGGTDAFITRLKPDGSLGFATYFGGSAADHGYGIAIDASRNLYVVGDTLSADLPVNSPISGTFNGVSYNGSAFGTGRSDGFVLKIIQSQDSNNNTTGLSYGFSSYLGGSGEDSAYDVAIDGSGNMYVVGQTNSSNFPVTAGAFQTVPNGSFDAFVTKVAAAGTTLAYSTFIGGSLDDSGRSIMVNALGNAYVTGDTSSSNLPTARSQQSVPQAAYGGAQDAFVSKLDPTGANAVYLTYYGGAGADSGFAITVDTATTAYVAGSTSASLPGAFNGFQTSFQGNSDAYVVALREITSPTTRTPTSLTFTTTSCATSGPATQNITLSGAAGTTYSVTSAVQSGLTNFLTVTPTSGSVGTNPTLTVGIDRTKIPVPGTYAGSIQVLTNQGETLSTGIALTVNPCGGDNAISTTHPIASYNTIVTYALNPATATNTLDSQQITINLNSTLPTSYSSVVATSGPNFVTVSPASGTTTGTPASTQVTITTNPAGLAAGTYTATVTFSAGGFTSTVYTVQLTIENPFSSATNAARPAKVGIFRAGTVGSTGLFVLDKNGDGTFNPPQSAPTDKLSFFGAPGDIPLVGDWNGDGVQETGLYQAGSGIFLLDVNNSGGFNAGDKSLILPPSQASPAVLAGDYPVVGDWTGTGVERVGIFRSSTGTWYLDVNGDGSFTGRAFLGQAGDKPVVGNWNGVGKSTKVGIFRTTITQNGSFNMFLVDYDGDGLYRPNGSTVDPPAFIIGVTGDIPVIGDWNGDGRSKLGIHRPTGGLFVLDYNGDYAYTGLPSDRALFLGGATPGDLPLFGNFVPSFGGPANVQGRTRVGVFRNGTFYLDVNGDGSFVGRAYLGQAGDIPIGANF